MGPHGGEGCGGEGGRDGNGPRDGSVLPEGRRVGGAQGEVPDQPDHRLHQRPPGRAVGRGLWLVKDASKSRHLEGGCMRRTMVGRPPCSRTAFWDTSHSGCLGGG